MKPLTPVSPGARTALGVSFFVLFVALWSAVTFGGVVQKTCLADPIAMLRSGWTLLAEMGFAKEVASKVCFLYEGVVHEEGPPDQIFGDPKEERTRNFLKRIIEAGRL